MMVDNGGARCEPCTEREKRLKREATMLEKHGVVSGSQIHGRVFNRELLDATLTRDNAILDETEELPIPLNRDSRIPFTCACGTHNTKTFSRLVDSAARCEPCIERQRLLKMEATMFEKYGVAHSSQIHGQVFNRELLDATLTRDNAILDETEELPTPLNRDSRIPFECACGTPHTKVFREMERFGARCEPCTERERLLKMEATMFENHGVAHSSHIHGQVFNRELLDATLTRDDAILDETEELPIPLKRESRIPFVCACGTPHAKVFREMEKYGARCEPCTEREKQLKREATCMEKYNCRIPLQNPEILERAQKSAWKRKDYTTPSGQVWTLQGYEPLVAPKLIDEYGEDDIASDVKQVPKIPWTDSKGVHHKYHCDFYVKSHKLVIEVKSTWTEIKNADKIVATREAANALGYGYRLIVLDRKGVWTRDEFSPPILSAEGKKPV